MSARFLPAGALARARALALLSFLLIARVPEAMADGGGPELIVQGSGSGPAAVCLFVGVGSARESADDAGITALLNEVILSTPVGASGEPLYAAVERMGGSVRAETRGPYSCFSLTAAPDRLKAALLLLAEAVSSPAITESSVGSCAHLARASLLCADGAVEQAYADLAAGGWEGRAGSRPGDAQPLAAHTPGSLSAWHGRFYAPDNMVVSLCAEMDYRLAKKAAEPAVARLSAINSTPGARPKPAPARDAGGKARTERAARVSGSAAILGYAAPAPGHPDYPAFRLAVAMLGAGMESRVFRALREDEQLAYSFGGVMDDGPAGPRLLVYVESDDARLTAALERIGRAVDALRLGKFTEAELGRAKGALAGELSASSDTNVEKAFASGLERVGGLGPGYFARLTKEISRLGRSEVTEAAARYLGERTLVIVRPAARGGRVAGSGAGRRG